MITTRDLTFPIGQLASYTPWRYNYQRFFPLHTVLEGSIVKIKDTRRHWLFGLQYEIEFGLGWHKWVRPWRVKFFFDGDKRSSAVWDAYLKLTPIR